MTKPSLDAAVAEGSHLGRYELRYRVAQGGMAAVYLARLASAHGFTRWVAIKVIHPHLAVQNRFRTMLLDEAKVAARIHHPNVCGVLDFGVQDEVVYLVMEYLHGESLSTLMRRAPAGILPSWLAARIIGDAARGLHAAHELRDERSALLGVVHRDVSPQNVLVLYEGIAKVVDFGIARARGRLTSTAAGELKGKLAYMSPEQLESRPVDRRTDVWALATVLWESTVGRRLFRAESEGATVVNVLSRPIPRPTELVEGYPAALEKIVMRGLARQPAERYATAAELADDLETFVYGYGVPAGPAQAAAWMREHLGEKLARRDELLQATLQEGTQILEEADFESESSLGSHMRPALGANEGAGPVDGGAEAEPERVAPRGSGPLSSRVPTVPTRAPTGSEPATAHAIATPVSTPAPDATSPAPRASSGLLWLIAIGLGAVLLFFLGSAISAIMVGNDEPEPVAVPLAPPTAREPVATQRGAREELARRGAEDPMRPSPDESERVASGEPSPGDVARVASGEPSQGERRRRVRRAQEVVNQAPGTLNVLAIPPAEVFLGARSLGRTPLVGVELPAGSHRLTVRALEGGAERRVTIRVRSGELTATTVRLGS